MNNTNVQEASSSSKLSDSDIIAKYDNKRIRINSTVYIISVEVGRRIHVSLYPMGANADTADNAVDRSTYKYEGAGGTYQKAVDKAHEIADEIEAALPTDIEN